MKHSKFLVSLLFSDRVPTDKVWRVEKFSVESVPVSLDACGEVRTSALHRLEEVLRVEWPELGRRLCVCVCVCVCVHVCVYVCV